MERHIIDKDINKFLQLLGIVHPIISLDLHIGPDKPLPIITISYYPRMDDKDRITPILKNYKLVEVDEGADT